MESPAGGDTDVKMNERLTGLPFYRMTERREKKRDTKGTAVTIYTLQHVFPSGELVLISSTHQRWREC